MAEMVAEMVLSPLVDTAIKALVSPLVEKGRMILHVDKDLDALSDSLSQINALLADAEEKQVTERLVKNWLRKLKAVAYDADDVLDEIVYEALRREVLEGESNEGKRKLQVRSFFTSCSCFPLKQVPFKLDIANRIKDINDRLAKIHASRQNFSPTVGDGRSASEHIQRPLTTSLLTVPEFEISGRVEEREEIKKLLLADEQQVSVISIVGMGGLGKTTLAQLIYEEEKLHFQVRAWVCVSESFDVPRLTKQIIESTGAATENIDSSLAPDRMQRILQDILIGKKFLIVVDDVWNENRSAWDQLAAPFRVGAKGSKIIVTTRSDEVSTAVNTDHTCHLKLLRDEDCLSLFLRHAFPRENLGTINSELMKIGEELVKRRCQGWPLAAKVLGGLLSSKRDLNSWYSILRSQQWNSMEGESELMKALRVSYHHLPSHIKQCFAFCSIFPKDYIFKMDKLVNMWMAQGFIQRIPDIMEEKIGSGYFDFLLSRSFFQVEPERGFENEFLYKMHDCIHDLAMSVSSEECFRFEHGKPTPSSIKGHRHLSFIANEDTKPEDFGHLYKCKGLRTFILNYYGGLEFDMNQVIRDLNRNLRCLRVLVLKIFALLELPDSISNLKHLRYLDLSYTKITQLPESVSNLYNLQTLKLSCCYELCQLPKETRKLVNLRHLNLSQCGSLQSMPEGLSNNLQTLNLSNCGSLQSMPELLSNNLQTLDLSWCVSLQSMPEVLSNNLQTLDLSLCVSLQSMPEVLSKNLQTLDLSWCVSLQSMPEVLSKNLQTLDLSWCESLQSMPEVLSKNLQTLDLSWCESLQSMPELLSKNLQTLDLFGCESLQSMPEVLSKNLQTLNLYGCKSLQSMPESLSNNLQTLNLFDCPRLTKMPNNFSALKHLKIDGCHQLECLPKCPSLVELELRDSNENFLRSVHDITTLSILRISGFKEVKSLPEDMLQPLVNLKDLNIGYFDNIKSLPKGLRSLTSLEELSILDCPQLLSLLEEGLPTSLRDLSIRGCPKLRERFRKGDGEDWAKISHIPNVYIN